MVTREYAQVNGKGASTELHNRSYTLDLKNDMNLKNDVRELILTWRLNRICTRNAKAPLMPLLFLLHDNSFFHYQSFIILSLDLPIRTSDGRLDLLKTLILQFNALITTRQGRAPPEEGEKIRTKYIDRASNFATFTRSSSLIAPFLLVIALRFWPCVIRVLNCIRVRRCLCF